MVRHLVQRLWDELQTLSPSTASIDRTEIYESMPGSASGMCGSWTRFFRLWKCFDSTEQDIASSVLGAQKQWCSANHSKHCRFGLPIYGPRKRHDAGCIPRKSKHRGEPLRGGDSFDGPQGFLRNSGSSRTFSVRSSASALPRSHPASRSHRTPPAQDRIVGSTRTSLCWGWFESSSCLGRQALAGRSRDRSSAPFRVL